MTFPRPTLYREPMMSLGHIFDTTAQDVRSEVTPVALAYGQAVAFKNGVLAVANKTDVLYGIARANELLKGAFEFESEAQVDGSYRVGEVVPVLTKGTIVVATAGAVKKGQKAILADGGKFAATDGVGAVVGTFMSDGTDKAAVAINL